jgi:hypothetical protein
MIITQRLDIKIKNGPSDYDHDRVIRMSFQATPRGAPQEEEGEAEALLLGRDDQLQQPGAEVEEDKEDEELLLHQEDEELQHHHLLMILSEATILKEGLSFVGFPGDRQNVRLVLLGEKVPSILWCRSIGCACGHERFN